MLKPDSDHPDREDPLVRSARREAIVTMSLWLAALTYTVGYCWLHAYGRSVDEMKFYWGVPDWVLWGIVAPWGVCIVLSWWFAFGFMSDEELGTELDVPDDLGV